MVKQPVITLKKAETSKVGAIYKAQKAHLVQYTHEVFIKKLRKTFRNAVRVSYKLGKGFKISEIAETNSSAFEIISLRSKTQINSQITSKVRI